MQLAIKFKKLKKHMENLCYPAHIHGSDGSGSPKRFRSVGLIRIQQDLDHTATSKTRENGPGLDQPGPKAYIKRGSNPVCSFLSFFLFLLFPLLSSHAGATMNPNPNSLKSTQKFVIYGSKASFSCSNHKSVAGIHMH